MPKTTSGQKTSSLTSTQAVVPRVGNLTVLLEARAPTLTAPFWDDASSAVKQKHAKDTHAANCACPEDGEEEEVEETDPEIGGGI